MSAVGEQPEAGRLERFGEGGGETIGGATGGTGTKRHRPEAFTDQDAASLLLGLSSPCAAVGPVAGPGIDEVAAVSTSMITSKEPPSRSESHPLEKNQLGGVSLGKKDEFSPSRSTVQGLVLFERSLLLLPAVAVEFLSARSDPW